MATTEPDPPSFGGQPDSGRYGPFTGGPKTVKKRPLDGIWTAAGGGVGPAEWRKHKGKIHGQARRKGEKNPMKFGLYFDDSLLGHSKIADWKDLPLRNAPKKPKEPKPKNATGVKKKCTVM